MNVAIKMIQPLSFNKRLSIISILLLIIIVGTLYLVYGRPASSKATTDNAERQALQSNLASAVNNLNDQAVVNNTTALINGQKSGNFAVNNDTLAMYYLEQGASLINLGQYQKAIPDFQEVVKLDSKLQEAGLQGELEASYNMGERRQLIPLLQQLENLAAKDNDSLDATAAQYQQDIQNIQNNQPISF